MKPRELITAGDLPGQSAAAKASGSAGLEVEDGQHRSQSSTVYVYLLIRSK
jgi:hypothetical protein